MKRNFLWSLMALLILIPNMAFAQKAITGTVVDENNEPLIQASVVIKSNTTIGTVTDANGKFTIKASPNDVLLFSYLGYTPQEIKVGSKTTINVKLAPDSKMLGEVVVTAMGIKRSEKSLPYATQKISGKALTEVPTTNFLSNFAGKTAGMSVSGSGSSVGSSVKIILRGNRSIFGNNQPLYVVDGTPINSGAFSQTGAEGGYGGGIDVGDGLSAINADDIESINVLKGASAAALYGSQAANGVIMITTKKGKEGKTSINISSAFQADVPYMTYKFQGDYGMGVNGVSKVTDAGWGPKQAVNNSFVRDFFRTGTSFITGVNISGGSEKLQNFLSYQNTSAAGIVDKNTMSKHNISLRSTTNLFDKFIEVDGSVALTKQKINHAPTSPGQYFNPVVGLYLYADGTDSFNKYKQDYELFDPKTNMMQQNWPVIGDINFNPYWLVNNHNYLSNMNKAITKLNLKFNLTDYLNFQLRGSYDRTWIENERKVMAAAFPSGKRGGRYEYMNDQFIWAYGDMLLQFNKTFGKLSVLATLGSSISDNQVRKHEYKLGDLQIPGIFDVNNYINGDKPGVGQTKEHRQLQSVFGTASLGYDDLVYLDFTARNDWSSTLPKQNRSFFYPSIGSSFIFSKLMRDNDVLPSWLNFGKLRLSWTQVGNDMPWGLTNPLDKLKAGGGIEANTVKPFTDLKPEKSTSVEAGLNLRMFDSRLTLDMAWYQTNTVNQYFLVDNTSGSGYSQYYINAGKVQNRGFEATLGFTPIRNNDFEWTGTLNFATNKNKIISLPDVYKDKGLPLSAGAFSYRLYEGKEWGEMYAKRIKRDEQGRVILSQKGSEDYQLSQTSDEERIGNVNPDFNLGMYNEFRYKNFSLGFQLDGRFGGNVISTTEAMLSAKGRSEQTGNARNAGGVKVPAVLNKYDANNKLISSEEFTGLINAQKYYQKATAADVALYKATNIRLRELSLSYNLPKILIDKTKFITGARISFIGRNLFFIYRDAPYDPEIALSTSGNGGGNADNFSLPSTRSFGISLNVNF
ncbi:SusC/RagA family TonB-linked outer membrane protein [Porphyromonas pogonae]|uniref:SusC/RagA family TonB-linked outer membrane protein n=1 Tax=Porphyromonas pogonae TaxID=867595 RepID=UPI002E787949|nr:SusC/RagA family TonB-linked outer membrane protein [Porphyromonas pogonae]